MNVSRRQFSDAVNILHTAVEQVLDCADKMTNRDVAATITSALGGVSEALQVFMAISHEYVFFQMEESWIERFSKVEPKERCPRIVSIMFAEGKRDPTDLVGLMAVDYDDSGLSANDPTQRDRTIMRLRALRKLVIAQAEKLGVTREEVLALLFRVDPGLLLGMIAEAALDTVRGEPVPTPKTSNGN